MCSSCLETSCGNCSPPGTLSTSWSANGERVVAGYWVHIADRQEMRNLDPMPSTGIRLFGSGAIQRVIQEARHDALQEILDRVGDGPPDMATGLEVARESALPPSTPRVGRHKDKDYDPMWRHTRTMVLDAGDRLHGTLPTTSPNG